MRTLRYHRLLPWLHLPPATGRAAFLLHKTYFSATAGGVGMTTSSAHASIHAEEALQAPPIPPAPWMPLGPLSAEKQQIPQRRWQSVALLPPWPMSARL